MGQPGSGSRSELWSEGDVLSTTGDINPADSAPMSTFWERLSECMREASPPLKQADIARALPGGSRQRVSKWKSEPGRKPEHEVIAPICRVLQARGVKVRPEWLEDGRGPKYITTGSLNDPHEPRLKTTNTGKFALPVRTAPILGWHTIKLLLAAGLKPDTFVGHLEQAGVNAGDEIVVVAVDISQGAFAVPNDSEAMAGEIPQGAHVVFEPSLDPQPGDWVLALRPDGSLCIRTLADEGGRRMLVPANRQFDAELVTPEHSILAISRTYTVKRRR